jgi:hypothetical protein
MAAMIGGVDAHLFQNWDALRVRLKATVPKCAGDETAQG